MENSKDFATELHEIAKNVLEEEFNAFCAETLAGCKRAAQNGCFIYDCEIRNMPGYNGKLRKFFGNYNLKADITSDNSRQIIRLSWLNP